MDTPPAEGRDVALLRAMGTLPLAAAILNGVVGGGIFSLPGAMAAAAGGWAPLAIAACGIAMTGVVLCYADAARRVASSGGAYALADTAFGPFVAFLTGVALWLSAVLACGGIASAMADGLVDYAPADLAPLLRPALIVAVIGGLAVLNIAGVAPASRAIGLLTLVKLLPLALLVLGGGWALLAGRGAVMHDTAPVAPDFGDAFVLALFALSGMETPLAASGEVARPERTIPRALALAMGLVVALYLALQLVCQGLLGASLAGSSQPLSDAGATISPALGAFVLLGASLSRLVWIGSDLLGAPRFLFAFARDGTLPAWLGRVHPVRHTPWVAILVHTLIAMALALTGTFRTLAILSGLASAAVYILICLAAVRLAGRAAQPAPLPLLRPAALLGTGAMVLILATASLRDLGGLALLLGLGSAAYAVSRYRQAARPAR